MMPKFGAHVSASGGIDKAIERAAAMGANCVQVFSGSPRVWARPNLDLVNAELVARKQKELGVMPIVTHALYLVNLASDNPELVQKSVNALQFDLAFDAKVRGVGVVVHVGSHQGRGWAAVREQVARTIAEILAASPKEAHFLIENSAGQKGKIASDLAEIRWLLDAVKSPQLGWCLDSCHAFAAGYELGQESGVGLAPGSRGSIFAEIERLNLASALRCVHLNDSRDPFASGRDRHANIGDGEIPAADLRAFVQNKLFADLPLILEVPGIDGNGPDAENITRLKKLAE